MYIFHYCSQKNRLAKSWKKDIARQTDYGISIQKSQEIKAENEQEDVLIEFSVQELKEIAETGNDLFNLRGFY